MTEQDELSTLRNRVAALETNERWRGRVYRYCGYAVAVAVVGFAGASLAADGDCPNGYPFCFVAGQPARANQINHNFDQIREWLEQKVGAVNSPDVTVTGNAQVNGSLTSPNVTVTNGLTSPNVTVTGNAQVIGSLTVSGALNTASLGGCYTHWGDNPSGAECAAGYDEVLSGHAGGLESYWTTGGRMYGNIECVADSAAAVDTPPSGTSTRMMRAQEFNRGMHGVTGSCSTCCRGGCYTAYGTATCALGYNRMYEGLVGGVEAFNSAAQEINQPNGKTLCIDVRTAAVYPWNDTVYLSRLVRFNDVTNVGGSGGMVSVTKSCAVCCR